MQNDKCTLITNEIPKENSFEQFDKIYDKLLDLGNEMVKKGFVTLLILLAPGDKYDKISGIDVGDNDYKSMTCAWFSFINQDKKRNLLFLLGKQIPECYVFSNLNIYIGHKKVENITAVWIPYIKKFVYIAMVENKSEHYNGRTKIKINDRFTNFDVFLTQIITFEKCSRRVFKSHIPNQAFIYHNDKFITLHKWYNECIDDYEWGYSNPLPKIIRNG